MKFVEIWKNNLMNEAVVFGIVFLFLAGNFTPVVGDPDSDPLPLGDDGGRDGSWWNTSWAFRKPITLNHSLVAGTMSDFPVLVSIVDGDLASDAQSDGDDLVFTNDDSVQLSHEIEFYDNSTGELVAWVNMTSLLDSVDTVLYLYYGNPFCTNMEDGAGVWNSDYVLVQHLNETSGTHEDSTSYDNDGTPSGSPVMDAVGMVDGGDSSDGNNISGFTIRNGGDGYAGINVSSHYTIIQDNILENNNVGIKLDRSSGNQIWNNTISSIKN